MDISHTTVGGAASKAHIPEFELKERSLETGNSRGNNEEEHDRVLKPKKTLSFHLSFLALNLMVLMVSLDATALAVATPPIYASISEIFGRKGPLYSSILCFVLGSIIFAVAKDMLVLIVGRVFQGIGAGGLDVLGEIILVDMTTLKERPLYLGLFAIPMAGGVILGPIIGSLCTQFAGWRWLGWINLPISALNIALIFWFMRLTPIDGTLTSKIRRVNWFGMTLFGIGCTAFAAPLSWAGAMYPWKSWQTILPMIFGFAVLVVFTLYENGTLGKPPTEPLFPARVFKSITATMSLVCSFFHGAIMYSGIFYMPLIFQAVFLESPLESAVSILPLCCTSVGFGAIAGVFVQVARKYRWAIIVSWILTIVGCTLVVLGSQIPLGIGVGPFFSLLIIAIEASVANVNDSGIAAGIFVCFRLFGGLVGLAICSTVFSNVFEARISSVDPLPTPLDILSDASKAVAFVPQLRALDFHPQILGGVLDAYQAAVVAVFLMLAGLAALGLLASFAIKEITIEIDQPGRQQLHKGAGDPDKMKEEERVGRDARCLGPRPSLICR
ncbi:MFS general substrate transporter [Setomelanomma holmii]|uniref:MFS general substrate transporter n=1 Tax=Setomelanomma holmii TaxID=210430 RepID=A0A9P4LP51_9PLEO|nr:MFS general substrate transporter [Setomelanomma holmii]